jgi:hypothetical protein
MYTYFGNRYGTNELTEANMIKTDLPRKHGGMHNFLWDRWGTKKKGVSVSR